ncbi:conserved hypothetical protein [Pseudomonas sp. OF001]|uniref:hypothetical protein n=1 Tax=Pseudomonas sp. OF001 TaxID=2772300 RepID=UPI00191A0370|nr:hypothetical protein [Pseudomonas sp. OF001]CAD5378991.1 conserved hypothetical protein [Pseudomonas sp. OF001]
MNTATERNYRETLDAAALGYLQRHQAQHLANEQHLFNLAVAYLMACYGAAKVLAENTVARVVSELRSGGERCFLDVSASTCTTAVIVDPASGISHSVPLHLICQLLLDNPERQRR